MATDGNEKITPEHPPESPKTDLRENLVSEATKFLENPKVQTSPEKAKRAFLSRKGLTEEEIDMAFKKINLARNVGNNNSSVIDIPKHPVVLNQPNYSFLSTVKAILELVIYICGASYGLKYLYENYLRNWLYGEPKERKKSSLEISLEMQQNLQKSMQLLTESVEKLQNSFESQKNEAAQSDKYFNNFQSDLQTLKGLLLNSNRFPANPPITTIGTASPSVPSWQLLSTPSSSSVTTTTSSNAFNMAKDSEEQEKIDPGPGSS